MVLLEINCWFIKKKIEQICHIKKAGANACICGLPCKAKTHFQYLTVLLETSNASSILLQLLVDIAW